MSQADLRLEMVKCLIRIMQKRGFKIRAAILPPYPPPSRKGRHEPDIIAQNDFQLTAIGLAKTYEELSSKVTVEQLMDFSARKMTKGRSEGKTVPFFLMVPREAELALRGLLRDLNLDKRANILVYYYPA